MRSQSRPISINTIRWLGACRGARGLQRLVKPTGPRTTLNRAPPSAASDLDDVFVGHRPFVAGEVDQALEWRPLAPHRLQVLACQ